MGQARTSRAAGQRPKGWTEFLALPLNQGFSCFIWRQLSRLVREFHRGWIYQV